MLFNYGSFDPFVAVDLRLTSQKRGRSPAMLRRERSILDQVQVRSILGPEMVPRHSMKPGSRKEVSFVKHHLPSKSPTYRGLRVRDNFHVLLTQSITITTSSDCKVSSTLQIALYKLLAVDLKYSVPPLWTIQSHLFGLSRIQEYVDLDPWVGRPWTVCQDR